MGPNTTYYHGDRYGSHWANVLRGLELDGPERPCISPSFPSLPLQTSSFTGRRGPRPRHEVVFLCHAHILWLAGNPGQLRRSECLPAQRVTVSCWPLVGRRIAEFHVHRSLAGPVPLARACVGLAGARATISTPSPIAVMLGGAMQEETTGMPNT